jgi:hypothetical protein
VNAVVGVDVAVAAAVAATASGFPFVVAAVLIVVNVGGVVHCSRLLE